MIPIPATADSDGILRVETVAGWVSLRPHRGGWLIHGSWFESSVWLSGSADPPGIQWAMGTGFVVAHLQEPILLHAGEARELWLAWTLELSVAGVHERARVGRRQTLLGEVDGGRILPAVRTDVVTEWEPRDLPSCALRVQVRNSASYPVTVRRIPVDESDLALGYRGERLICGTIDVVLADEHHADSRCVPLSMTLDQVLRAPTAQRHGMSLRWLLDATRRSTEPQQ